MSECSLLLEDQLNEFRTNESLLQRLLEENKLKQMAIDKATWLVRTLTEEISMLRHQLEQSNLKEQRVKD